MGDGAVLALLFGTPGLVLVGFGFWLAWRRYPIWFGGVPVTGRITRWRYHAMGYPGSGTTPDVTYEDASGNRHVAVLTRPRDKSKLPLGSELELIYHPARPHDAHEPGSFDLLIVPLLPVFAGLLMILLAAGMYFGAP